MQIANDHPRRHWPSVAPELLLTPGILSLRLTSFYLGFSPVTVNITKITFNSLLFTLLYRNPFHHGLHATPSPRIPFP